MKKTLGLLAAIALLGPPAQAQDQGGDLALQLANPLASLVTMPVQLNYDEGLGPNGDGAVWRMNVQPIVPFTVNEDWYVITRTIAPVLYQDDIPTTSDSEFGLGDILQSFFFSPSEVPESGWIVGGGPVVLYPSATDDSLGAGKWALGPTAVALKQIGSWTVGALANHIWSIGGPDGREDINLTYLEPWVSYTTPGNATLSLNAETNYDWNAGEWSVPLQFTAEQLLQIGEQNIQIGGAVRYWAESPTYGPQGFGVRLQIRFLFPT